MPVDESATQRQLADIKRWMLEMPASVAKSFRPIMDQLQATIITTIQDTYSTTVQMLNAIAHPGVIAPTDVNATGQVSSVQAFKSAGSHDYIVSSNYVAAWINGDGTIGTSPSTVDVKKDLEPMTPQDVFDRLNSMTAYWGRYDWDDETEPLKVFLLAEDVKAAGFGPDVAPCDANGKPYTVNYSQLIVPMIAAGQAMQAEIEKNQADIADMKAQIAALTA